MTGHEAGAFSQSQKTAAVTAMTSTATPITAATVRRPVRIEALYDSRAGFHVRIVGRGGRI